MPEIHVTLLGRFAVTVGGVPVAEAGWERRHAAAVVKVLALAPGRRLHREQVIDLVWPGDTIAAAVPKLHKAAHFARRAIGAPGSVVLRGDQVVRCPGGNVTVDAVRFGELARRALDAGDAAAAREALALYGGELLPADRYEEWAEIRREQLSQSHLDLLRLDGQWEAVAELDPGDERAHLALMRRHAANGDRHAALRQYDRLDRALRQELGLAPGPEASALRDRLLAAHDVFPHRDSPLLGHDLEISIAERALLDAAAGVNRTDEFVALSGLTEAEAFGRLDDALAARIIEPASAGYRFRHCLIRDALTGDVPAHRRRQIHRDTARRLVEPGASPVRIGHHFLAAGAGADAVPHLLRAAETESAVGAYRDALALVDAIRPHAAGPCRTRTLSLRADLLTAIGDPMAGPATGKRWAGPACGCAAAAGPADEQRGDGGRPRHGRGRPGRTRHRRRCRRRRHPPGPGQVRVLHRRLRRGPDRGGAGAAADPRGRAQLAGARSRHVARPARAPFGSMVRADGSRAVPDQGRSGDGRGHLRRLSRAPATAICRVRGVIWPRPNGRPWCGGTRRGRPRWPRRRPRWPRPTAIPARHGPGCSGPPGGSSRSASRWTPPGAAGR